MNRRILRLAIPNIVTNLTVPLLGMADLALMGHLKADSALYVGAIALGSTIFNVVYVSFGFLRMGTSGFTAQAFGAKNNEKIALTLQRTLSLGLLLALLLLVLQYPIQWLAFKLLDGETSVKNIARQYFYIRIYAAPATLLLYGLYGWFLGMQNARIPMFIAIVVNSLNVGLDFFFVYVFRMKSDGVALASVIAQYSGLVLSFVFLFSNYKAYIFQLSLKKIINAKALREFFGVNTDIFIRTLLLIFVLAFFTSHSADFGNNILAVNTLLFQFFFIFSYFADGFAYAGEALTGKAKGLGDARLLKKTVRYLFKWGWGIAIITSLIFWIALPQMMEVMTDNTELLHIARNFAFWVVILPFTSQAAFIWDGIYIGVTASKAMRNTMIIASLIVFVPAFYFSAEHIGNHSLWLALELFMMFRGLSMWLIAPRVVFGVVPRN